MAKAINNPFGSADEVMSLEDAEKAELGEGGETTEPVVQATPEPEPEPAKPEVQEQQDSGKDGQYIPRARFNEVNDRMKRAEEESRKNAAEAQEMRERWARYDERFKQRGEAEKAIADAARQANERPDASIDPVGAKLYDLDQQLTTLVQQDQARQQQMSEAEQNRELEQVNQYIINDVARYRGIKPDYLDAAEYAVGARLRLVKMAGWDDVMAARIVRTEALAYADKIRKSGGSIAEWVYELATTFGYRPAGDAGAPAQSNGTANGSAPGLGQRPGPTVNQLRNGQQASGLSNMGNAGEGARTPYREYTPSQVAQLSEREWARIKADPTAWRELKQALARHDGIDVDQMGRL